MKKISHKLLGTYLWNTYALQEKNLCRLAFQFGCVEPDYNYTTYLKGTFRGTAFHGHNYQNASRCMKRLVGLLTEEKEDRVLYWYRLGKLAHYTADAFTFPHNDHFTGDLSEHLRYENDLHTALQRGLVLRKSRFVENPEPTKPVPHLHAAYMEQETDPERDIAFIIQATSEIMQVFQAELCRGMRKELLPA